MAEPDHVLTRQNSRLELVAMALLWRDLPPEVRTDYLTRAYRIDESNPHAIGVLATDLVRPAGYEGRS